MTVAETRHVVMLSGGVGSWATAKRVAARYGTERLTLLVANTNTEADDWLPFIQACHANIGGELVMIDNNGQDIWDIFERERFIGNSRLDTCSKFLKRVPLREWIEGHCDPTSTVIYLGFDWTEEHRLEQSRPYWTEGHPTGRGTWQTWKIAAPLTEAPYLQKAELVDWLTREGMPIPKLYTQGFSHNNCSGACVKAGQAQWRKLLAVDPDTYAYHEQREREVRVVLGDVAILRRRGGARVNQPLTLEEFRLRQDRPLFDLEGEPVFDSSDWGSCSCMAEPTIEESQSAAVPA